MRMSINRNNYHSLHQVPPSDTDSDVEAQIEQPKVGESSRDVGKGLLDRVTTERRLNPPVLSRRPSIYEVRERVSEKVPPEWALLLMGCFLGFATGLSVVAFNRGVHLIHDFAWAGTPHEGAAWLRLQSLTDTWHRIMLIPVTGGVVVGLMHTLLGVLDQIKASRPQQRRRIDFLAASCPVIKATQAAVTLGTGCSLGPEGPSVDIGKSCAHGCSEMMKNNRERRIALVAAGAAAGIASGFNAAVSGCFFAIETVLRPLHAENSPPLTTAMIILASVIASTVSNVLLGETPAFTVPTYELRSAAGVLYWGFTNIDEILHSGKTASAPGVSLLTQLLAAKVVATALCKGSGLVGGVYAPSLFIGSALGSVYGAIAGQIINAAIPGHAAVAHPQAYALVGMAATLASVCSVPLTSVLLLFELTKDYHILLPLMGAVGLAIWVAAVAKDRKILLQNSAAAVSGTSSAGFMQSVNGQELQIPIRRRVWRRGEGSEVEVCTIEGFLAPEEIPEDELLEDVKVSQAMSKDFVKVQPTATVKEAIAAMLEAQQRCVLVVDDNDLLEGIMTLTDLHDTVVGAAMATSHGDVTILEADSMLVASICTSKGVNQGDETDLVVCYRDMNLYAAQQLMDINGVRQMPVVSRGGKRWQDRSRQVIGLLNREAIPISLRAEATKRIMAFMVQPEEKDDEVFDHGH
ncbi:hypothetical protein O6H91_08G044500 [Diphasiastrum complanatum]|uniref:Uncharacterized protein n=1 Tax=Diphasiastrum complanatum TaxID=34168 RepID=A0ACC2CWY5_DIPCM|nr:hypothetical protein O6H91_08G044500 [Diphasiastrum complanatum]